MLEYLQFIQRDSPLPIRGWRDTNLQVQSKWTISSNILSVHMILKISLWNLLFVCTEDIERPRPYVTYSHNERYWVWEKGGACLPTLSLSVKGPKDMISPSIFKHMGSSIWIIFKRPSSTTSLHTSFIINRGKKQHLECYHMWNSHFHPWKSCVDSGKRHHHVYKYINIHKAKNKKERRGKELKTHRWMKIIE